MKLIIEGKELEYCPQHGYLLPCAKCGLGQYELGKQAGIKEVLETINYKPSIYAFNVNPETWQSKLKEWGIE